MKIEVNNPLFGLHASAFISAKMAESTAILERRNAANALLELSEIKAHAKPKGDVSFVGERHKVTVTYVQTPVVDIAEVAKSIPAEYMSRVFVMKPAFSQSGLNALVKELEGAVIVEALEGMQSAPSATALATIKKALADHTEFKTGATQISVEVIKPE